MARRKPGLAELQAAANLYAQKVLSEVPFPVPGLTDAAFTKLMDTISAQLVQAWAAGYKAGTER